MPDLQDGAPSSREGAMKALWGLTARADFAQTVWTPENALRGVFSSSLGGRGSNLKNPVAGSGEAPALCVRANGAGCTMPPRTTARIVPPSPITVAIEEHDRLAVAAYGVIANISEGGGCIWTDGHLRIGGRLSLQVSFALPPEVHDVTGLVVWGQVCREAWRTEIRRYGLQWVGTPHPCVLRLKALAGRAVAPVQVRPSFVSRGARPASVSREAQPAPWE
jgi:hypothetical protein